MLKISPRVLIPVLSLGVLLTGCSTPSPQPPAPSIVVIAPAPVDSKTIKRPTQSRRTSKPRPKPPTKITSQSTDRTAPQAATAAPAPEAPVIPKTPATSAPIATFVTAGQLESASTEQLVFAGNNAAVQEDQGLFEDAILLSRVRASLKAAAEPDLASTAKVSSGTVTLDVPANYEPKTIAAAVDTALNTSGVRKVQVNVPLE